MYYLLGVRIHALVHLLAYLHSWLGRIKPAISETIEDRAKDVHIKSYTGFRLPP